MWTITEIAALLDYGRCTGRAASREPSGNREDDTLVRARVSTVILVDPRGWLLLQERDGSALVAPNRWGLVGGHLEPDEDFEAAAYRELAEETGLRWDTGLINWFDGHFQHRGAECATRIQVWVAPTDCTDRDITVGEGRQIIFVDPAQIDRLDLGETASHFVRRLLESPSYPALVETARAAVALRQSNDSN